MIDLELRRVVCKYSKRKSNHPLQSANRSTETNNLLPLEYCLYCIQQRLYRDQALLQIHPEKMELQIIAQTSEKEYP